MIRRLKIWNIKLILLMYKVAIKTHIIPHHERESVVVEYMKWKLELRRLQHGEKT